MLQVTALLRPIRGAIRSALLIAGATALMSAPGEAQAPGYLNGAPLSYEVPPPPPKGSPVAEMDLTLARALRAIPGSREEDEAIADAQAYFPSDVIPRFNEAAHVQFTPKSRPIMFYMLSRALPEAGRYLRHWKETYPRERPYVGDTSIKPCFERFLKQNESYPSGHAENGMAAGLLIAEVNPEQRQALIARGIRYGQNRVVCGVHYASDVFQGQLVGADYVARLLKDPSFRQDLDCARAEQRRAEQDDARKTMEALPARCEALHL